MNIYSETQTRHTCYVCAKFEDRFDSENVPDNTLTGVLGSKNVLKLNSNRSAARRMKYQKAYRHFTAMIILLVISIINVISY